MAEKLAPASVPSRDGASRSDRFVPGRAEKTVGEQWARKAEENIQIQAELETAKARYMERVRRNLDGAAREKATFGRWSTMKQQETQSMAEAVELSPKTPAAEPASRSLEEVSLIDASAKPVRFDRRAGTYILAESRKSA